jgi:hypothetical protein
MPPDGASPLRFFASSRQIFAYALYGDSLHRRHSRIPGRNGSLPASLAETCGLGQQSVEIAPRALPAGSFAKAGPAGRPARSGGSSHSLPKADGAFSASGPRVRRMRQAARGQAVLTWERGRRAALEVPMEIVRLGVVEGPSEYSQDAVLEVVLQPSGVEGLHRHRLTAFFEMAVSTVRAFRAPSTLQEGAHRMAPSWQRSPQELMAVAISSWPFPPLPTFRMAARWTSGRAWWRCAASPPRAGRRRRGSSRTEQIVGVKGRLERAVLPPFLPMARSASAPRFDTRSRLC